MYIRFARTFSNICSTDCILIINMIIFYGQPSPGSYGRRLMSYTGGFDAGGGGGDDASGGEGYAISSTSALSSRFCSSTTVSTGGGVGFKAAAAGFFAALQKKDRMSPFLFIIQQFF